ncbi:hypothetical protein LMH87_001636 [Akanthomyces muscarius]|uniref:Uncharacterized protein n=1 Tax=Akanthomyces muscarius TaxID=2231603 RepID=A0A9W8Q574_AKAMU|nr:hypothetical protein LMH87_001636 [Akanthomyces muscarius]KAJ4147088.1 hypothetical protein LMH87_001636 [Akanthomyces muscarius]
MWLEHGTLPEFVTPLSIPVPYFGHVQDEHGGSRLYFAVESTATYRACKESRAFLQFFFAEETKPEGGLPSWYCSETDTIKFNIWWIDDVIKHPWFLRTQHLELTMWNEECYLGNHEDVTGHDWIEENLASLRDVTVRINEARTWSENYTTRYRHWLTAWFRTFESFYNPEEADGPPLRFYLRVVSDTIPEEEWLSPTNYLRVEKLVHQKMLHFDPQHKEHDTAGRKAALMAAADDELDNPAQYLARRRLARRLVRELESAVYSSTHEPPPLEEEWSV